MRSLLDSLSWPARCWLADRLVGHHAYSRNVFVYHRNEQTQMVYRYGLVPYTSSSTPIDQWRLDRNPSETA